MKTKNMKGRICTRCKKYKKASEFRCRSNDPDKLRSHCKKCEYQTHKEWTNSPAGEKHKKRHNKQVSIYIRQRNKKLINEAKDKPCLDCRKVFPTCAMEFDHVPGRGVKTRILSNGTGSVRQIIAEIKKCDIVCANCHRIRGYYRRIGEENENGN